MKTLSTRQVMALLKAGFPVANVNPMNLTSKMKKALADAGVA